MRTAFLAILLISCSVPAYAIVVGPSNLGPMGYEENSCRKPIKPYDLSDEYAVDSYNSDLERYTRCMREYLEGADNDIRRIKEAAEEAIAEAKRDW